jgi:hypothetical protein
MKSSGPALIGGVSVGVAVGGGAAVAETDVGVVSVVADGADVGVASGRVPVGVGSAVSCGGEAVGT